MPVYLDIPGYAPQLPTSPLLAGLSAGPLALIEFAHPNNPIPAGVPANGAVIPDLAASLTAATLGQAPGDLTVASTVGGSSVKVKMERSSKGGIHTINSRTQQTSPYELWDIALDAARLAFLNAHNDHDIYVSAWWRETRAPAAGYAEALHPAGIRRSGNVSDAANRWVSVGAFNTAPNLTPPVGNARRAGGASMVSGGSGSAALFVADAATEAYGLPTPFVVNAPLVRSTTAQSSQVNKTPSVLLYRVYVEDLTVSGRTADAVAAIDLAEFQEMVLTSGGRYYGDTWTDPATFG